MWKARAARAMNDLILLDAPFTADDLIERVGLPDFGHTANGRNSAVGAVFRDYSTRGLIVTVGHTQSRQPHRKGGLIRVWQRATPQEALPL